MTLPERLTALGVPPDEIERAAAEGSLPDLLVERTLLGVPRYDSDETAARAGLDPVLARRLWRALGFTDPRPGEHVFTDADVEATRSVRELLATGRTEVETTVQLTRVIGSSLARIAEAQVAIIEGRVAELRAAGLSGDELVEALATALDDVLPAQGQLLLYVHRRHLQASVRRAAPWHEGGPGPDGDTAYAVGFADLVGFTALSQQLDEGELARVVDRFESLAYDTVGSLEGRVVKMIGDEVMFVASDARAIAEVGLTLAETYAEDETLSDVRVGLATGPAISREGDYFGPAVNLASRLVNIAYPGTVVASATVHDALVGDEAFRWKPIRPRRLKGLGWTTPWVLLRAGSPASTAPGPGVGQAAARLGEAAHRVRSRRRGRRREA